MSQNNNPAEALYPSFLRLTGRRVLLVGGGSVAAGKLSGLLAAGACVTVVAPDMRAEIREASGATDIVLAERAFEPTDLDAAWFAVAAATAEVNLQVAAAAAERRVFVNVVDDPALASAYAGGVIRRGAVTVAVSTGGAAPALAGLMREALDALVPSDVESWLPVAGELRRRQRNEGVPMPARRPQLLEALNRLYEERPR